MSISYSGPQLPVYHISIIIPKVPIDNSAPTRRATPQPRVAPQPTYLKPSAAVYETRINYENYAKMCEGIEYLEAKENQPCHQ